MTTEHFIGSKKHLYHFCPLCDYIFKDPVLYTTPDAEKKRYLSHHNSPEDKGYMELLTGFYATAVRPFMKGNGGVLDYGSGPVPVFAGLLEAEGLTVDLYDPFFAPLEIGTAQKYSVITLVEVIEHIKEPAPVFGNLLSHLTNDGLIAVMTLFHPGNPDKLINWWYRQDITHVGFFSAVTMRYLAEQHNLEIVHINEKNICTFKKSE